MPLHLQGLDWQTLLRFAFGRFMEGSGVTVVLLFWTILASAVITYLQAAKGSLTLRGLWHQIFPPGTFSHPSARTDILFWLSKRLVMPPLVLLLGVTTYASGHVFYAGLSRIFGPATHVNDHPSLLLMCLFTVTMLVVYDFSNYSYHRLQHRVPALWELHKTHHSAMRMIGLTKDRVHPVEELMSRFWTGLISGPVYALWLYVLHDPVELTILGVNAYALINTVIMLDFVRHTGMRLSYGKVLNHIFLCPHYHQLHHSIEEIHYDRNFGQVLAIWDWCFGTLCAPKKNEEFQFGLSNREDEEYQSLLRIYSLPVIKALGVVRHQMTEAWDRIAGSRGVSIATPRHIDQ